MYQKNFDFIVEKAQELKKPLRVAIAGADVETILLGAFQAAEEGFAELFLFGKEKKIKKMLKSLSLSGRKHYTIIPVDDEKDATQDAIDFIKAGNADALMRGNVTTRDFLMPILDKKNDLVPHDRLLSHIALLHIPEYHRLIALADVSVVVEPNKEQRKEIIRNTVNLLEKLGYKTPNVAMMSLVEKPTLHLQDTLDAVEILKEHKQTPVADCNLVGPISYDMIMSSEAARLKNYDCDKCGKFDAIIAPNLGAGNIMLKASEIHGHGSSCGILSGAVIPIAITSRSEPLEQAYFSIAFCAALYKTGKNKWPL